MAIIFIADERSFPSIGRPSSHYKVVCCSRHTLLTRTHRNRVVSLRYSPLFVPLNIRTSSGEESAQQQWLEQPFRTNSQHLKRRSAVWRSPATAWGACAAAITFALWKRDSAKSNKCDTAESSRAEGPQVVAPGRGVNDFAGAAEMCDKPLLQPS